jgi:hypothetical protein
MDLQADQCHIATKWQVYALVQEKCALTSSGPSEAGAVTALARSHAMSQRNMCRAGAGVTQWQRFPQSA